MINNLDAGDTVRANTTATVGPMGKVNEGFLTAEAVGSGSGSSLVVEAAGHRSADVGILLDAAASGGVSASVHSGKYCDVPVAAEAAGGAVESSVAAKAAEQTKRLGRGTDGPPVRINNGQA